MEVEIFTKIGKRHEILGWDGENLTIGINAPPVKGVANEKLIQLLSEWLDISKNSINIVSGHTSRHKRVSINIEKSILIDELAEVPHLPRQMTLL